jgi:hypothetical protein
MPAPGHCHRVLSCTSFVSPLGKPPTSLETGGFHATSEVAFELAATSINRGGTGPDHRPPCTGFPIQADELSGGEYRDG